MAFYICSNCGFGSATLIGKCPDCGSWNTLKPRSLATPDRKSKETQTFATTPLHNVEVRSSKAREKTGIFEFDRVLGGGFLDGHVALITGEPGIGKSTLLLQALQNIVSIYLSGEESASQVKNRATRLNIDTKNIVFSETLQIEAIVKGVSELQSPPKVMVIDSIQMLYSQAAEGTPGSVSQLRECALQLVRLAKLKNIAIILIGHVTKDGDIAGPKIVEHMVDTVLTFEGDKLTPFRILRASKNRFGTTDEIGIFVMEGEGLKEVTNPLAFLSEGRASAKTPGRAIAAIFEGKRPVFIEIQALATPTTFPSPRRVASGLDYNRLQLLLAICKKHLDLKIDNFDVYVSIMGGIKVASPAADLGVIAAIVSSCKDKALPEGSVFLGEVGLLGEIRKTYGTEQLVAEAKRLGLKSVFSPLNVAHIKDLSKGNK